MLRNENPKPSILVFVTRHLPIGGIESHIIGFCRNMARSGTAVDLIVLNSEMLPGTERLYRQTCRNVYLGRLKRSRLRLIWLFFICMRIRRVNYTALYTNGQGKSIWFIAHLLRAKLWVHHHHTSGDASDQATWDKLYKKALLKADKVISCSRTTAGNMRQSLKRDVDVMPPFSRKLAVFHHNYHATKSKLNFGYYGRLIPEKGIDLLCRLSEDCRSENIEFHIWGEGNRYPRSYFTRFSNLKYHGTFSGESEQSKAVGMLDAFLLLSTHPEGLPVSLLEAMSAGLPWLATDKGGVSDIAFDPVSTRILSSVSNYSEVLNAVVSFAKDIRAGIVSRESQISLYEKNFSPHVLLAQWERVLGIDSRE